VVFSVSLTLECSPFLLHGLIPASPWFSDFCAAKIVKGADNKIPRCYFACFLPAGFPFSLTGRESGYSKRKHEIIWLFALDLSLFNGIGKIENPDGDASADEENKKKFALQERRKGKISSPSGLRLSR